MAAAPRQAPAAEAACDWRLASDADLVAHLLDRYHAVHRRQLPELLNLARRIELVHVEHDACPRGLAEHLSAVAQKLESHMRKEEDVLFPMLLGGHDAIARMPIGVMRGEHAEQAEDIRRIADLCGDGALPADACASWQALYARLDTFCRDLRGHIGLEDDVLFARHTGL